jgi:predicted O-linked N-acetylglucosamine transferase (SPINDLY family)
LAAELFEKHDRSQFHVIAFSFGPFTCDGMQQRLVSAFDDFIDVRHRCDKEIAILARELEIDIAVDLNGFTRGCRPNIFAMRAAPVQVNYLDPGGTMGADYMDYLIADMTVIPASSQKYFSERIAYLPNTYLVNDSKRRISTKAFTRAELGLPEDAFVFCCFNNNYKITPEVFDSWMRILQQVDGSVLWLFEGNAMASSNLTREAKSRGLKSERLIFAQRIPLPDHLARLRLADVFLDTLPYNAHTTASDALWAGLPVLTRIGETFAGRVAASLLNAIGLPELITSTSQEYETLAIELATDDGDLANIKRKLAENRLARPLFDTQLFTQHIEAAYTVMYQRYQSGLAPDHIYVPQ